MIMARSTHQHANPDTFSCLPLHETSPESEAPSEIVLLVEGLDGVPVTAAHIATWTGKDLLSSSVSRCILYGWPDCAEEDMQPYWRRYLELSLQNGCILWGTRVVIPPKACEHVLCELHEGHAGVFRMKALAHSLVWWPAIDNNIEHTVQHCQTFQQDHHTPPPAPLHPWSWPTQPWTRLHLKCTGPIDNKMYLVVIDTRSKWLEVFPVSTVTTSATVQ